VLDIGEGGSQVLAQLRLQLADLRAGELAQAVQVTGAGQTSVALLPVELKEPLALPLLQADGLARRPLAHILAALQKT